MSTYEIRSGDDGYGYVSEIWEKRGDGSSRVVGCDASEPEDATLGRSFSWVLPELQSLAAKVENTEDRLTRLTAAARMAVDGEALRRRNEHGSLENHAMGRDTRDEGLRLLAAILEEP